MIGAHSQEVRLRSACDCKLFRSDEIEAINGLEEAMKKLSDAQLKAKTPEFWEKLDNGATVDDLLIARWHVHGTNLDHTAPLVNEQAQPQWQTR